LRIDAINNAVIYIRILKGTENVFFKVKTGDANLVAGGMTIDQGRIGPTIGRIKVCDGSTRGVAIASRGARILEGVLRSNTNFSASRQCGGW
jgi:hypothetical protein